MRKSNHQTLADYLKKMLDMLEQCQAELEKRLKFIQLMFTEIQYVQGRPLMTDKALKVMAIVYSLGACLLAPSKDIQIAFRSHKLAPARFDSLFLYPPAPQIKVGWFTPWRVKTILPANMKDGIERFKLEAFLYCASENEIDHHLRWLEEEKASDSFVHQLRSIEAISLEGNRINYNSTLPSKPIFEEAIKNWRVSCDHSDTIPKTNKLLYALKFAPAENQTCWDAWQQVVKTIHENSCLHRKKLLTIYREELEKVFFQNLVLEPSIKECYLSDFRDQVMDTSPKPKNGKEDRWDSISVIDCWTASKLIMHIVLEFIKNPEEKALGEAACALWTMAWCSHEAPEKVTKSQVLALCTSNLNVEEATIQIKDNVIEIADGLCFLQSILRGRGTGERKHLLFKNLTSKEFERILKNASSAVLGSDAQAVSPSAFLTFPHIYNGTKMPKKQRLAMLKGRRIVKPRWLGSELTKDYIKLSNS